MWLPTVTVAGAEYGAEISVPTATPSTKNCTLLTENGVPTEAVAVTLKDCPAFTTCPAAGAVSAASRGGALTVITFTDESVCCGVGAVLSTACTVLV